MAVVASLVRGRSVADALKILEHTPRHAAQPLAKLISSAAANADHNNGLKEDSLQISRLEVNTATRGKRFRPAAHGRALPYQLKYSNVKVEITGTPRAKKATPKKAVTTKSEVATPDTSKKSETPKAETKEKK
jgi:large subunit ribosomal protein L22